MQRVELSSIESCRLEGNYEVGSQESEDLLYLTVNCTSILLRCQRHLLSFADVIARHQIRTLRRLSNIFLSTFPMLVQLFDIDRLASTAWQQLRHCLCHTCEDITTGTCVDDWPPASAIISSPDIIMSVLHRWRGSEAQAHGAFERDRGIPWLL